MLQRIIYLGYYLKNTDKNKISSFLSFATEQSMKSRFVLIIQMLANSISYNISILEYFQFGFYKSKPFIEKQTWAGTGYMYEYQKIMNPPGQRNILDDKTKFYKEYQSFFKHHVMDVEEMQKNIVGVEQMLQMPQVVLKESNGKCGLGTSFVDSSGFTPEKLIQYMKDEGFDLAETFITQHKELNELSPSGVNTVRIITQLNVHNEVEILGCRQRISVNSPVDNLAAGNLAAPIDEQTGIISGPGVYSDITKQPEEIHPITGTAIIDFQVPFWSECLQLAKDAALHRPQNRSIGWDIVVTEHGPGLIEGNHDWCKLVWQLPVNKGLKPILENHLAEYKKL